eukprot:CAMPEP_0202707332 /NCGR_PEP_ID=MMETSP1385-20130828/19679_1 /ASSEMBLY_ACC=CAM_ASM_000861 /TAXON_ID=933848 /ORGANISM="Elphidium margaritaceum" /LENGTH=257 /DNA_ID=CAMNT_0049366029 /DNA_START=1 /DNA_END=774 /DNA_ORIENTATION=+
MQEPQKAAKKKQTFVADVDGDGDMKTQNESAAPLLRYDLSGANKLVSDQTIVVLNKCTALDHYFHASCAKQKLDAKQACPKCSVSYGEIVGHQPDGQLYISKMRTVKCAGFESSKGSIKMFFEFTNGMQDEHHPSPGKKYFGEKIEAYLPNNTDGREACMLTRWAFKRRLLFQIKENCIEFGSIDLKTKPYGGAQKRGFPDANYFRNFKNQLKAKAITVDLFTDDEKKFIEEGFQIKNFKQDFRLGQSHLQLICIDG